MTITKFADKNNDVEVQSIESKGLLNVMLIID